MNVRKKAPAAGARISPNEKAGMKFNILNFVPAFRSRLMIVRGRSARVTAAPREKKAAGNDE